MSERGVFAVDRGIFDHPLLKGERFTKVQAMMWLVSEAAWKARRVRVAGIWVELKRGQVAHSLRHLADEWQWTVKRVRTFLRSLEDDGTLSTDTGTGLTVITICNYDEYQRVSLPKGTPQGTGRAQEGHAEGTITKTGNTGKDSEAEASGASAPAGGLTLFPEPKPDTVFTDSKHELWSEGPPILASLGVRDKQARGMIGRWMRDARDDALTVLSAIKRARENRVQDPVPWITRAIANGQGPPGAPPSARNVTEQRAQNWNNSLAKLGEFARHGPAESSGTISADTIPLLPFKRADG